MEDLTSVFIQFFALVNVLDELICHQDYDLIDVKGQVKRLHFVLDFEEVAFEDFFYVSYVNGDVADFFHLVPIHL